MTQTKIPFFESYTRDSYLIESSRRPVMHLVDFEGFDGEKVYCSCEAFTIGKKRPCKHIKTILENVKKYDTNSTKS
jgi:hypothetical protein